MSQIGKLAIAIVLALIGAGLNWLYLQSRDTTTEYLTVTRDLAPGATFPTSDEGYSKIPFPNTMRVGHSLLAYKDRGSIYGARVRREFKAGDPVFFSDVADDLPRYETLGPFTLLSVGEFFTGAVKPEESGRGRADAITIEPRWKDSRVATGKREYDDQTRRLLQIIEGRRSGQSSSSPLRIVAIEARPRLGDALHPADATPVTDASKGLIADKERVIIVALDNIATIPAVLQIGTEIAFVVPALP